MKNRRLYRCIVLLSAMAVVGGALPGQTLDPAQMIRNAQRTRVAPALRTPTPAAVRLRHPSRRTPTPTRSRIESFVTRAQELPAQVAARQESEPAPAATPASAPNRVSEAPVLSAPALGVATLLAFAGTALVFVLVRRLSRRRGNPVPAPVTVTPFDRPVAGSDQRPLADALSARSEDEDSEGVPGFARSHGEIELAQAIERLRQRIPTPTEPRAARTGRKTQPRGAEAARRRRTGKGELDLAYRLEKLRETHRIAEEQQ